MCSGLLGSLLLAQTRNPLAAGRHPRRFVFYETVDMRALRPLEQTRELHPGVKSLQAWLGEHRAEFEQLFGSE